MEALWYAAGAALVFAGLVDLFFAVLHYDGFGPISGRLYPLVWRFVKLVARPFRGRTRSFVLSLGAPLMVPATITLWIALELLGFALIYVPGMHDGAFAVQPPHEPGLWEAVYVSGVSISTLGFGDIVPVSGPYQFLTFSEALTGFIILTLSISYVLNIYQALQRLSTLGVSLHHQTSQGDDPRTVLGLYLRDPTLPHLSEYLMSLHRELVAHYEDVRRYPIVYYFHSRRPFRSMPYAFWVIGELSGAIRWGLPRDHPGASDPWVPALITGWTTITERLEERFISIDYGEPPAPVPFEEFTRAYRGGAQVDEEWLKRFLHLDGAMRRVARLDGGPDAREAYERYRDWLPFAHRATTFFEETSRFLGYDPSGISADPARRLF